MTIYDICMRTIVDIPENVATALKQLASEEQLIRSFLLSFDIVELTALISERTITN